MIRGIALKIAGSFMSSVADNIDEKVTPVNDPEIGHTKHGRAKKLGSVLAKIQKEVDDADLSQADATAALHIAQDLLADVCSTAIEDAPGALSRWLWRVVGTFMRRYRVDE